MHALHSIALYMTLICRQELLRASFVKNAQINSTKPVIVSSDEPQSILHDELFINAHENFRLFMDIIIHFLLYQSKHL